MQHNKTTPLNLSPIRTSQNWRPSVSDVLFATACVIFFTFGGIRTKHLMDIYEVVILAGTTISIVALAWFWRPLKIIFTIVALLTVGAIALYQGDLARSETVFGLKYMLASQPGVLWMSFLFVLGTCLYWAYTLSGKATLGWLASSMTYAGLVIGMVALMVRWHESYLVAPDVGHIPVSTLYEVFIVFALITAAFYLYYEDRYKTASMGGFIMLIVCAIVGFLLWYSVARGAHEIKPLIPALQSWWMKIHVPANFIGYGTFSIAAMVGFAYLIKFIGTPFEQLPKGLQKTFSNAHSVKEKSAAHARHTRFVAIGLWLLGAALFIQPIFFRPNMTANYFAGYWYIYFAIGLAVVGSIILLKNRLAAALPSFDTLDDVMYKSIAVGFVFFTIATILGALWAADAWGKYWSWDPKETWALIVWLNYAAWLHLRLVAGLRGLTSAYWAIVGILITGFAFLGVNIFLSGLHSYGGL